MPRSPSNPYADYMIRTNQSGLRDTQEFAQELSAAPRIQGDDLTGDDPDAYRQLDAWDRQTKADLINEARVFKDDLARMRRDVATRDDRASAQRDAQGYNAYDAFADTIVQDTLAGAGLVVY